MALIPAHIRALLGALITSPNKETSRVRTESGQTGFDEGREFRLDLEVSAAYVVKFSSPVDFVLRSQSLSSHDGTATFTAYGAEQGTTGGTFGDAVHTLPNNGQSTAPAYTPVIVATGGGAFTPDGGETPREFIKSVSATATSQRTTVGGNAVPQRGLPAGDYYLMFTGNDASYRLIYEEKP